jgi:DNA repair exonuclease SbcCD nuclease subunit
MKKFNVLHTADLHITNKVDKLEEVMHTCNAIVAQAKKNPPDLIVLAGDTVDEYDGPIRIDSVAARYAISLVAQFAEIAPVAIVRGTKSHDRDTPYLFRELKGRYPIHVATKIEQVALIDTGKGLSFHPLTGPLADDTYTQAIAVLTFMPSPDKSRVIAVQGGDSVEATTLSARELLGDAMALIGEANASIGDDIPRIMIGHGMITGAVFSDSSAMAAVGEDLEFSPSDLAKANCDLICFGHIHKYQEFPGNIFYSGSPGRLTFGEKEKKGYLLHVLDGQTLTESVFFDTPAREFSFFDYDWADGADGLERDLISFLREGLTGHDVRVRIQVPEEERHLIDRAGIESRINTAGAKQIKIEVAVIPKQRQRAAGISNLETLPEKVKRWGETIDEEVPESVLVLAGLIEGRDIEELIEDANRRLANPDKKAEAA